MKDSETIEGITYYFASPDELPQGYLERISRLVESGGSVDPARVRENLGHAFLIVYVVDDSGEIIACAALKHPRAQFTEMVREQTGLDLEGYLERGYSSVRPEYRGKGIASKMLAGLTARAGKRRLYSIVGEDNIGGQKIALNNNTRKVAVYESVKTGKKMGIWIPEWMIDNVNGSAQ
ncbi:MAG: GNAT family N-acetyltransferase [Desulfobacteraceae bacterium]|nr:GNAT family N-acetyltransferase [Desulfobacteraceae bacterium]